MNLSDFFYFTVPTDYADYNYFTDFVKIEIRDFSQSENKFSVRVRRFSKESKKQKGGGK